MEALIDRRLEHERFGEYCAALPAWVTYSINRTPKSPAHPVEFFMFQYRSRQQVKAGQLLPPGTAGPTEGVRYARPGERPPSTRPHGANDDVIERFDMFTKRFKKAGNNGR